MTDRPTSEATIRKRSVAVAGHRTSVTLEVAFWIALKALAARRDLSLDALVTEIDAEREGGNLSSSIRVYVLREAGAPTS